MKNSNKIVKEAPFGIIILSALSYALMVLSIFLGYVVFAGGGVSLDGIIFILLAVLLFFIGKGLRKVQNWARITAIVLSGVVLAYGVTLLFKEQRLMEVGIVDIIISCLIGGYLLLSKKVKAYFNK